MRGNKPEEEEDCAASLPACSEGMFGDGSHIITIKDRIQAGLTGKSKARERTANTAAYRGPATVAVIRRRGQALIDTVSSYCSAVERGQVTLTRAEAAISGASAVAGCEP